MVCLFQKDWFPSGTVRKTRPYYTIGGVFWRGACVGYRGSNSRRPLAIILVHALPKKDNLSFAGTLSSLLDGIFLHVRSF